MSRAFNRVDTLANVLLTLLACCTVAPTAGAAAGSPPVPVPVSGATAAEPLLPLLPSHRCDAGEMMISPALGTVAVAAIAASSWPPDTATAV